MVPSPNAMATIDCDFIANVADHGAQRQHRVLVEGSASNIVGQIVARIADHGVRVDMPIHRPHRLLGHRQKIGRLGRSDGAIQRVRRGHRADQD